ncbi:MAG: pyridoxal-phosphate dependent enzyme [Mycobacterium sp.]
MTTDLTTLDVWPLARISLVHAPTPLHLAPRLSEELSIEIWFKRDDMTGIGLGGNKIRGLEYLLADALAQGCDSLVTGAGPQSNWAMLAGLTARQMGIEPYLVHYGTAISATGNLLLCDLANVHRTFTGSPDRTSVDREIERICNQLTAAGRRPYPIPRGGATSHGVAGYVRAGLEMHRQWRAAGIVPTQLWLATGSCATHAGLLTAAQWLGWATQVIGVTVSRSREECTARIVEMSTAVADLLHILVKSVPRVRVLDGYIGPGYGIASPAGQAAASLVAQTEGIFLDPIFGAKAMAALIDAARDGRVTGPVVFLVTGGAPTLFASTQAVTV